MWIATPARFSGKGTAERDSPCQLAVLVACREQGGRSPVPANGGVHRELSALRNELQAVDESALADRIRADDHRKRPEIGRESVQKPISLGFDSCDHGCRSPIVALT